MLTGVQRRKEVGFFCVYFTTGSVSDVRLLNGGLAPPSCN